MRLVLPTEPDWALHAISGLSLATAVYASGMALVQRDGRRFFCYLFLSHSSLVLVGLEMATPIGLAAGLSMWLSVGLALTSYGITLRCIEARVGRIDLDVDWFGECRFSLHDWFHRGRVINRERGCLFADCREFGGGRDDAQWDSGIAGLLSSIHGGIAFDNDTDAEFVGGACSDCGTEFIDCVGWGVSTTGGGVAVSSGGAFVGELPSDSDAVRGCRALIHWESGVVGVLGLTFRLY
jgi:hypothetical protein